MRPVVDQDLREQHPLVGADGERPGKQARQALGGGGDDGVLGALRLVEERHGQAGRGDSGLVMRARPKHASRSIAACEALQPRCQAAEVGEFRSDAKKDTGRGEHFRRCVLLVDDRVVKRRECAACRHLVLGQQSERAVKRQDGGRHRRGRRRWRPSR
jgi:hypothetical protein